MPDFNRRRLLAWGGTAALGSLAGCQSFYESAFLRSPVYDSRDADEASNAAAAAALDASSASRESYTGLRRNADS